MSNSNCTRDTPFRIRLLPLILPFTISNICRLLHFPIKTQQNCRETQNHCCVFSKGILHMYNIYPLLPLKVLTSHIYHPRFCSLWKWILFYPLTHIRPRMKQEEMNNNRWHRTSILKPWLCCAIAKTELQNPSLNIF